MATAIHQYEDKLLDFAYGELPAPEASAVESHLKSCVRCTQALDQIRGVRTTMAALPQEPAPVNGLDSLLAYAEQAAARNAAAPRATAPWWRRMVAPLAGACALTLVAVVAIKTQDEVDLSAKSAVLEAKQQRAPGEDNTRYAPPPVAAAPILQEKAETPKLDNQPFDQLESQKVAQKMKTGKVSGAAANAERKSKEDRAWDTANKQNALAKNNNEGYSQALGETKGPAEERQQAQREDLAGAVAAAQKESKTRREAPTTQSADADFGNARGGYAQGKQAEDSKKQASKGGDAPMGLSTAPKPSAPSARPQPAPPPAQVAAAEPERKPAEKSAPSLGMSMGSTSGSSGSGLGTRSSSSAYKVPPPRDNSDDESGAGRLKDAESEQRDQEVVARRYLEAARSASNNGNRQEEVKQALAVLQTNVKGSSRAEALNRLCTGLEELGNEGQARKYCDALLREFPNTAAAKVIANRRNSERSKSPAKRSADYESADKAEKVEPAKAAPAAEQKPASAY